MNCRISSSVIGSRASPSTLWTDNRYCVIVVLLVLGGHIPPLTPLRTGLAQTDTYQEKLGPRGAYVSAEGRPHCSNSQGSGKPTIPSIKLPSICSTIRP